MYNPLTNYKKQAKQAARDFSYGKEVEERIKNAKSEAEICRIMITARHKKFGI